MWSQEDGAIALAFSLPPSPLAHDARVVMGRVQQREVNNASTFWQEDLKEKPWVIDTYWRGHREGGAQTRDDFKLLRNSWVHPQLHIHRYDPKAFEDLSTV